MSEGSVSDWIAQLKAGEVAAAKPLWDRYFERLVTLARGRLASRVRRVADEEDVALSAFHSFSRAAAAGRFPRLDDRDDLWALLVTITERKIFAHADRETARKRGSGQVRGDSVFEAGDDRAAPEPTPAFAAEVAESYERLLARLDAREAGLRQVAEWKMEGYTNEEVAEKIQKSVSTVERKLAVIRTILTRDSD